MALKRTDVWERETLNGEKTLKLQGHCPRVVEVDPAGGFIFQVWHMGGSVSRASNCSSSDVFFTDFPFFLWMGS